ncbi:MAG: iron ABC transporter permease [Candidatus Korarchaeota archaeon]
MFLVPIIFVITNISPIAIIELLSDDSFINAISFSFLESLATVFFSFLVGFPGAFLMARSTNKYKSLLRNMLWIPFMMPPSVVCAGLLFLWGEGGILTSLIGIDITGFWLVICAHVFFNAPLVIIIVSGAWERIDPSLEESAEVLGATPVRKFFRVILPALRPAIEYTCLVIFLYSFMAFTTVLLLGGVSFRTIEVEIYSMLVILLRKDIAASAAFFQFIILMIVLIGVAYRSPKLSLSAPNIFAIRKRGNSIIGSIYWCLIFMFFALPLTAVLYRGAWDPYSGQLTFEGYAHLFSFEYDPILGNSPANVVINTIAFATLNALISVSLSIAIAMNKYRKLSSTFFLLPSSLSTMMLTLGLFVVWNYIDPSRIFRWMAIIIAHITLVFPFVQRGISSALESIPSSYRESALTLATPFKVFQKVEFPMISPQVIAMGFFAFTYSLGEMGATMALGSREYMTISVMMRYYLGMRQYLLAASSGGFLLVISLLLIVFASLSMERMEMVRG